MAKKAGSEDPRMSPTGTPAAATPGDNAVVTEGSFLQAVKEITAATLLVKEQNERRKTLRKKWKASGISLGALDAVVRLAEWDRGEIREHFSVERQYAGWLGLPVEGRQANLFKDLSDDQIQAKEWHARGRTASRTGKAGRPPEECPPEFHQDFMRGFNDEDEGAWADSEKPDEKEQPKQWAGFPDEESEWSDDQVREFNTWFEGLGGNFDGVFVGHVAVRKAFNRLVAAHTPKPGDADAAPPAPQLKEPDWSKFDPDPANWFAVQKQEFQAWYDSLPAGETVRMSHPGVRLAFKAAQADEVAAGGEVADDAPVLADESQPLPEDDPPILPKARGAKAKAGQAVH